MRGVPACQLDDVGQGKASLLGGLRKDVADDASRPFVLLLVVGICDSDTTACQLGYHMDFAVERRYEIPSLVVSDEA
jgi:hypothetical protein